MNADFGPASLRPLVSVWVAALCLGLTACGERKSVPAPVAFAARERSAASASTVTPVLVQSLAQAGQQTAVMAGSAQSLTAVKAPLLKPDPRELPELRPPGAASASAAASAANFHIEATAAGLVRVPEADAMLAREPGLSTGLVPPESIVAAGQHVLVHPGSSDALIAGMGLDGAATGLPPNVVERIGPRGKRVLEIANEQRAPVAVGPAPTVVELPPGQNSLPLGMTPQPHVLYRASSAATAGKQ